MFSRFSGKAVVITGGATGIGLACARAFVEGGAGVLIIGNQAAPGRLALETLKDGPGQAAFFRGDVRKARQMTAAFAQAESLYAGIDILVNNAGLNMVGHVDELNEAQWDLALDTNLKGAFLASREAIPRMKRRGGGVIVNISSNAGLVARPQDPAYSASKAGLVMLTRSMALAHAAERIRVNAVCPGPVSRTTIFEEYVQRYSDPQAAVAGLMAAAPMAKALGRLIVPDEVAAAVVYLCSDEAQMVTGAILAVDGGKSAGGAG